MTTASVKSYLSESEQPENDSFLDGADLSLESILSGGSLPTFDETDGSIEHLSVASSSAFFDEQLSIELLLQDYKQDYNDSGIILELNTGIMVDTSSNLSFAEDRVKYSPIANVAKIESVSSQLRFASEIGRATVVALSNTSEMAVGTSNGCVLYFDSSFVLKWCDKGEPENGSVSAICFNLECTQLFAGYANGFIQLYKTKGGDVFYATRDKTRQTPILQAQAPYNAANTWIISDGLGSVFEFKYYSHSAKHGEFNCLFEGELAQVITFEILQSNIRGTHILKDTTVIALATVDMLLIVTSRPRRKLIARYDYQNERVNTPHVSWQFVIIELMSGHRAMDPVLASVYDNCVSLYHIRVNDSGKIISSLIQAIKLDYSALSAHWVNARFIGILDTREEFHLIDVRDVKEVEKVDASELKLAYNSSHFKGLHTGGNVGGDFKSLAENACYNTVCRSKCALFFLSTNAVYKLKLNKWSERIESLVENSKILNALCLGMEFVEGKTYGIKGHREARFNLVKSKIFPSLIEYIENLTEDVSNQTNLAKTIEIVTNVCICLRETDLLFEELWAKVAVGSLLYYAVLNGISSAIQQNLISRVPPNFTKQLFDYLSSEGRTGEIEEIIFNLSPDSYEPQHTFILCRKHGLFDALIAVWNKACKNYDEPLKEIISLIHFASNNNNINNCAADGNAYEDFQCDSTNDIKKNANYKPREATNEKFTRENQNEISEFESSNGKSTLINYNVTLRNESNEKKIPTNNYVACHLTNEERANDIAHQRGSTNEKITSASNHISCQLINEKQADDIAYQRESTNEKITPASNHISYQLINEKQANDIAHQRKSTNEKTTPVSNHISCQLINEKQANDIAHQRESTTNNKEIPANEKSDKDVTLAHELIKDKQTHQNYNVARQLFNKSLVYLSSCLTGRAYRGGNILPEDVSQVRNRVLMTLCMQMDSSIPDVSFPFLRTLISFDVSDFCNALIVSFADPQFPADWKDRVIGVFASLLKDQINPLKPHQNIKLLSFIRKEGDNSVRNKIFLDNKSYEYALESILNYRNENDETDLDRLACAISDFIEIDNFQNFSEHSLLKLAGQLELHSLKGFIYERIGNESEALECFLRDNRNRYGILEFLEKAKDKNNLGKCILKNAEKLFRNGGAEFASVFGKYYSSLIPEFADSLSDEKDAFDFLSNCVESNSDPSLVTRYFSLLCKYRTENQVTKFISKCFAIQLEPAIEIARKYNMKIATTKLLERQGNYQKAFDELFHTLENCENSKKIDNCENSKKIDNCENSKKIDNYCENAIKIDNYCENSKKIDNYCENSKKIDNCENSKKIELILEIIELLKRGADSCNTKTTWLPLLEFVLEMEPSHNLVKTVLASVNVERASQIHVLLQHSKDSKLGDFREFIEGLMEKCSYEASMYSAVLSSVKSDLTGLLNAEVKNARKTKRQYLIAVCCDESIYATELAVFNCGHLCHKSCLLKPNICVKCNPGADC